MVEGRESVADELRSVASGLPSGGEDRPGQIEMAEAVAKAMTGRRNLVVQAGTGTGKSLAYLVPALHAGRRVVVATATKALQDQLATKDLPFLASRRPEGSFSFAVLKGRSNYLCRQRVSEAGLGAPVAVAQSLTGETETGSPKLADQIRRLATWGETSPTGDRSELDFEPDPRAWSAVSVGVRECPGAFRCPSGNACFTEQARARAAAADVVVVNMHLYASHVASGGAVLPEHDVLIVDEAHELEDVMTEGLGVELTPGRMRLLAQTARGLVDNSDQPATDDLSETAEWFDSSVRDFAGRARRSGHGPRRHSHENRRPPRPGSRGAAPSRARSARPPGRGRRHHGEAGARDTGGLASDRGRPDDRRRQIRPRRLGRDLGSIGPVRRAEAGAGRHRTGSRRAALAERHGDPDLGDDPAARPDPSRTPRRVDRSPRRRKPVSLLRELRPLLRNRAPGPP